MDCLSRLPAERYARISQPSVLKFSKIVADRRRSLNRRQRSRLQLSARRQRDDNAKDNSTDGLGNNSDSLMNRSLDELKQLGEDLILVRKAVENKDVSWAERSLKAILDVESLLKDTEDALEEENVKSLASDPIQANKNSIYHALEEIRDDIIMVSNMLNATKEQPKNEISVLATQIKKIDRLLKEERRARQKSGMFSATQIAREREKNVEIKKRTEAMNVILTDADNIIDDAMGLLPSQDPRTLNGAVQHVLSSANETMYKIRDLELEIGRKSRELEDTAGKYETVQADLQELHNALQASQTEAEAANELVATLNERVDMLQKSLEAAQNEAVNYKKAFEDSSVEASAANELTNAFQEKTSLLESTLEATKKEQRELQETFETTQKDLNSANENATALKSKVEALEKSVREKEEAIEDVEVTEALLAAKIASLEDELLARQSQIDTLSNGKQELDKVVSEAQAAKSRLIQVEKALKSVEAEKTRAGKDLIEQTAQVAEFAKREMQLNQTKEELETEMSSLQNVVEGLKQQLQTALEENRSNLDLIHKISKESEQYMSASLERERMMNDQVESLLEQTRIFEDEREELASLLQTTTETVESLSHENEMLKMEQEEVKSLLDSAKADTEQFEVDLKAVEDEKDSLVNQLEASKEAFEKMRKSQDDNQHVLRDEMQNMEDMVESATNDALELKAQMDALTSDQAATQEKLAESRNANGKLEEENSELRGEYSKIVAERDDLKENMSRVERQLQDMHKEMEERRSFATAELLDEIEKIQDSKNMLQEEIAELRMKLEASERKNGDSNTAELNGKAVISSGGVDNDEIPNSNGLDGNSSEEEDEEIAESAGTVAIECSAFTDVEEEQQEATENSPTDISTEKEMINTSCNGAETEVTNSSSAGTVAISAKYSPSMENEEVSHREAVSESASEDDLEINTLEVLTQVTADQLVDSAVGLPVSAGTVKTTVTRNKNGSQRETTPEAKNTMFARSNPIHKAANVIAKVLNSSRGEVSGPSKFSDPVPVEKESPPQDDVKKPGSQNENESNASSTGGLNKRGNLRHTSATPRERTWYP